MKVIEIQQDNYTIKKMVISHRFNEFPNIVCSGGKMYQLPCQIKKKSYELKELNQKYHIGMIVYLIESKRISTKRLKELAYRVTNDDLVLSIETDCPF